MSGDLTKALNNARDIIERQRKQFEEFEAGILNRDAEAEPDDWEPGSIEHHIEENIRRLVVLKDFETARAIVADILNREADNRRPRR